MYMRLSRSFDLDATNLQSRKDQICFALSLKELDGRQIKVSKANSRGGGRGRGRGGGRGSGGGRF